MTMSALLESRPRRHGHRRQAGPERPARKHGAREARSPASPSGRSSPRSAGCSSRRPSGRSRRTRATTTTRRSAGAARSSPPSPRSSSAPRPRSSRSSRTSANRQVAVPGRDVSIRSVPSRQLAGQTRPRTRSRRRSRCSASASRSAAASPRPDVSTALATDDDGRARPSTALHATDRRAQRQRANACGRRRRRGTLDHGIRRRRPARPGAPPRGRRADRVDAESRGQLIEAFEQASAQTRAKLGADTVPRAGDRASLASRSATGSSASRAAQATVAVWYVGIVGSGATVEPQQSWRTQIVSLVWERGAWKVSSFESSPGPTPPLSTAEIAATARRAVRRHSALRGVPACRALSERRCSRWLSAALALLLCTVVLAGPFAAPARADVGPVPNPCHLPVVGNVCDAVAGAVGSVAAGGRRIRHARRDRVGHERRRLGDGQGRRPRRQHDEPRSHGELVPRRSTAPCSPSPERSRS